MSCKSCKSCPANYAKVELHTIHASHPSHTRCASHVNRASFACYTSHEIINHKSQVIMLNHVNNADHGILKCERKNWIKSDHNIPL